MVFNRILQKAITNHCTEKNKGDGHIITSLKVSVTFIIDKPAEGGGDVFDFVKDQGVFSVRPSFFLPFYLILSYTIAVVWFLTPNKTC